MSVTGSSPLSYLFVKRPARKLAAIALANKKNLSENSAEKNKPVFQLKLSNKILAQSAVGVFALGFIDAGYSGDWSRIGVISRECEDLLKAAAFIVVPLCLFLVFSLSRDHDD